MTTKKEVINWLNLYIKRKKNLLNFLVKQGKLNEISFVAFAIGIAEEMVNILTIEKEEG